MELCTRLLPQVVIVWISTLISTRTSTSHLTLFYTWKNNRTITWNLILIPLPHWVLVLHRFQQESIQHLLKMWVSLQDNLIWSICSRILIYSLRFNLNRYSIHKESSIGSFNKVTSSQFFNWTKIKDHLL